MPKKPTYDEVVQQIQKLQQQAEALKREEVEGVIARIREAVEHYNLTPEDIFGKGRGMKAAGATKSGAKGRAGKRAAGTQYADDKGNTWGGRGPRPRWLREALAAGADLKSFRTSVEGAPEGVPSKSPGAKRVARVPRKGKSKARGQARKAAQSSAAGVQVPAASSDI